MLKFGGKKRFSRRPTINILNKKFRLYGNLFVSTCCTFSVLFMLKDPKYSLQIESF